MPSKEIEQLICDLTIKEDLTQREIANKLKTTQSTVSLVLIKYKIKRRLDDPILCKKICDLYVAAKLSEPDIAIECNTTVDKVRRICKNYKIPNRGLFRSEKVQNSFIKCDETFFEVIDSPEKAWVLGFITGDGYLVNRNSKHGVIIKLCDKDIEVLEKIKKYMKADQNISLFSRLNKSTGKFSNFCELPIYRKKIYDDLVKLGLKNKSKNLNIPNISYYLIRDYIRGLFCSDGCFHIEKTNHIHFQIVSSAPGFLEEVQNFLIQECELEKTKIIFYGGSYRMRYGGNVQVRKIFNYLYEGAEDIFLERKYNYAENHFDNIDHDIITRDKKDCPVNLK